MTTKDNIHPHIIFIMQFKDNRNIGQKDKCFSNLIFQQTEIQKYRRKMLVPDAALKVDIVALLDQRTVEGGAKAQHRFWSV